jgi:hypothetical protein
MAPGLNLRQANFCNSCFAIRSIVEFEAIKISRAIVQTGSGAYQASYIMGAVGSSSGGKAAGA